MLIQAKIQVCVSQNNYQSCHGFSVRLRFILKFFGFGSLGRWFFIRIGEEMALGRRHGSQMKGGDEELGLGFVPVTRSLSRKRILVSSNTESSSPSSVLRTPLKRRCGEMVEEKADKSMLEAMPQDILVGSRFMNLTSIDIFRFDWINFLLIYLLLMF